MTLQTINIDGIGAIVVSKRRGMRHMRISLSHSGEVKVSMPHWASVKAGVEFAKSKTDWINKNRPIKNILEPGLKIGKAHVLTYVTTSGSRISGRIAANEVRILVPAGLDFTDPDVQKRASLTAIKALTMEANKLLPQRLRTLAQKHGLSYRSSLIKNLKTRWGSCSSHKDITLNCFLMQLPWELIDYVIIHELTHTVVLAHGPAFWTEMAKYLPNTPDLRKQMRTRHPAF